MVCRFGEKERAFVLDTGASVTTVTTSLAKELGVTGLVSQGLVRDIHVLEVDADHHGGIVGRRAIREENGGQSSESGSKQGLHDRELSRFPVTPPPPHRRARRS